MVQSRIAEFADNLNPPLLILTLQNPDQTIFIRSDDAYTVYGEWPMKEPMYQLEGNSALFMLNLKRANGDETEISWSCDVEKEENSDDLLFFNLKRVSR